MKILRLLLHSARGMVLLASVGALLSGSLNAALIAVVHFVLTGASPISWLAVAGFMALVAGRLVTSYLSEVVLMRYSQRSVAELRVLLIDRLLAAPYRQFEITGKARVLAALTDDIGTINGALMMLPAFAVSIAVLTGGACYLLYLSWRALLALAAFALIGATFYRALSLRAVGLFEQARDEHDRLHEHLKALTEGTKELKLHRDRRRAFLEEQVGRTTEALMKKNVAAHSRHFSARVTSNVFFFALVGMAIFALPVWGAGDNHVISGYVLTCLYLIGPLNSALRSSPVFGRASIALARVEALGVTLSRVAEQTAPVAGGTSCWQRIALRGVTYRYETDEDGHPFVLGPIDLDLEPGQLIFITGGNGSGKTTMAKVLTGLYSPYEGQLLWDGQPVTDHNRDDYRQLFSAVFSDFHLFETMLGLPAAELDRRASHYLRKLRLDHKVSIKEGVLSSTHLSHGQRRRLALLTAYLEDRPLYLFDEWAADQDPEFKQVFHSQLIPELKERGKTVIVITHDDRFLHLADRLLEMKDGRIVRKRHH